MEKINGHIPQVGKEMYKELIKEKTKGTIFGAAIGDAIGVQTLWMTKEIIDKEFYGFYDLCGLYGNNADKKAILTKFNKLQGISFPYLEKRKWKSDELNQDIFTNDWTYLTDIMILCIDSIVEQCDGSFSSFGIPITCQERNHARKLVNYFQNDKNKIIKSTMLSAYKPYIENASNFIKDPIGMSVKLNSANSDNFPLLIGIVAGTEIKHIESVCIAEMLCKCLNMDSRCVASCTTIANCIHRFIYTEDSFHFILEIIADSIKVGLSYLNPQYKHEFYRYTNMSIESLQLDDATSANYCFKTLGIGLWALRELNRKIIKLDNDISDDTDTHNQRDEKEKKISFFKLFQDIILDIVEEGGNSCYNAMIAGALLGSVLGERHLHQWLEELPQKNWLKQRTEELIYN